MTRDATAWHFAGVGGVVTTLKLRYKFIQVTIKKSSGIKSLAGTVLKMTYLDSLTFLL